MVQTCSRFPAMTMSVNAVLQRSMSSRPAPEDADNLIYVRTMRYPNETGVRETRVEIIGTLLQLTPLVYQDGFRPEEPGQPKIVMLPCDMGAGDCIQVSSEYRAGAIAVHFWLHVPSLLRRIEQGHAIPFRSIILAAYASRMTASRSINVPLMMRSMQNNNLQEEAIFRECAREIVPREPAQIMERVGEFLNTPLWSVQRHFVNAALRIEEHGFRVNYLPRNYARAACESGAHFYVDREKGLIMHPDDASDLIKSHTFHGGFLLDSIGLGKTLSMLSMCALRAPPENYQLDDEGNPRRCVESGHLISRATLVVCPSQAVSHWCAQAETHLKQAPRIVVIATKRDHERHTFADLVAADFVVVSFNFVLNCQFRAFYDGFGQAGWSHFASRVRTALHETKRQRTAEFAEEPRNLGLAHVHFWRLIVDEFHEVYAYQNRMVRSALDVLSAETRWGVSASVLSLSSSANATLSFLAPKDTTTVANIITDVDALGDVARQIYVRSDPDAGEIALPGIREQVHWIDFTADELNLYMACHANSDAQIRVCCVPRRVLHDTPDIATCGSVREAIDRVAAHMRSKLNRAQNNVTYWSTVVENARAMIEAPEGGDLRVLRSNLAQAERQLQLAHQLKDEAERSLRFVSQEDNVTESCVVCLEDMQDPCMFQCGHQICSECLTRVMDMAARRCPTCRADIGVNDRIIRVQRETAPASDEPTEEAARAQTVRTHGSKLAAVIDFVRAETTRDAKQKFVLFARSDMLLHEVGDLLKSEMPVLFVKGSRDSKQKAIDTFRKSADHPVLLLSSQYSGSGVDLTVASNVIILDTMVDNQHAVVESEKQAIGRVYRPPQNCEVRVHRFLVRNTIEEQIYERSLRHIALDTIWDHR